MRRFGSGPLLRAALVIMQGAGCYRVTAVLMTCERPVDGPECLPQLWSSGPSVRLAWGGCRHSCVGDHEVGQAGLMRRHPAPSTVPRSGFADFRFPPDVIMVAVRWYLRYGLSYRDVEELLAERGIEVDLLVRDAPRSMVAMTRWYRSAVLVPRAALARSRAQRSDSP